MAKPENPLNGFLDSAIKAVNDALMNNPAYPVVVGGQVALMNTGMKPLEAWEQSRACIAEFLKDEGVKIGHPAYAWTPEGGAQIVQEYLIDHFETKERA